MCDVVQIGHRGPFLAVILFQWHVLYKTVERVLFAIFRGEKKKNATRPQRI